MKDLRGLTDFVLFGVRNEGSTGPKEPCLRIVDSRYTMYNQVEAAVIQGLGDCGCLPL